MNQHFYKVYRDIHKIFYKILKYNYDIRVIEHNIEEKKRHIAMINFSQLTRHDIVSSFMTKSKLYELIVKYKNRDTENQTEKLENYAFYFFHKNFSASSKEARVLLRLLLISFYFLERKKESSTKNNEMVIYWIPLRIKRDFNFDYPREKKILNIEASKRNFRAFCTSGLNFTRRNTKSNDKNKDVSIVTRVEEIEKLLIHELIHNIKLDKRDILSGEMYSHFNKIKKNNYYGSKIMLIEIFTEWASTLYFVVFFIFFKKNSAQHKDLWLETRAEKEFGLAEFTRLFQNVYKDEVKFSLDTVFHLIGLNGYKDIQTFNKEKYFYGQYPFFEYYFMKTMAMMHCAYREDLRVYEDILNLCESDFPLGPKTKWDPAVKTATDQASVTEKIEKYYAALKSESHKKKNYRFLKNKIV